MFPVNVKNFPQQHRLFLKYNKRSYIKNHGKNFQRNDEDDQDIQEYEPASNS